MNILLVCHRFPYPPNRGGKIRPFHMIQHLARRHRVVVATLAHSHDELQQGTGLANHCDEIVAEVLPSSARWLRAVQALPTLTPSSARYFWSPRLLHRILETSRRIAFDAIIVHCAFVAHYVRNVPARLRVLDYGDLDSRKWADYSLYRRFPWSAGYALEAAKLQRVERQLAAEFDHCTVTAHGEFESYSELGVATPCTVIPNGVDADYFHISAPSPRRQPTIVFLGRMDYFPNVAGCIDFARNIFPLVRKHIPDAQFRIVGSNPVGKIRALANVQGIAVTGFVSDVRPHVEDATVAIAPLAIARGTQNKVLECMAMGLPIVTSPQVAKGVQAKPERDLLVGETHEQFAHDIVNLMRDASLRQRIAEAGRKQVISAHDWNESMKSLGEMIERYIPSRAESEKQPQNACVPA